MFLGSNQGRGFEEIQKAKGCHGKVRKLTSQNVRSQVLVKTDHPYSFKNTEELRVCLDLYG